MTEQNKHINQDFLFIVIGEIINRIERCGASVELTHAVSLASDLRQAIGNKYNKANEFTFERIKKELGIFPTCKGRNCGCIDGVSHSKECLEEHDRQYTEEEGDLSEKTARRNHRISTGGDDFL